MTGSETHTPVTPASIALIVWRQKIISALVFLLIAVIGCTVVLVRPKTYESSSSIALLPVSTNSSVLQNYPNLIASLIPTYVQLVSSPAFLDRVAARLPFPTSGQALANEVSAQSLSSAAVINIVAKSSDPPQARQIATAATSVFLNQVWGNGVVVPKIYGLPMATPTLAPPHTSLLLALVLVLAVILALAAGLICDRLFATTGLAAVVPAWITGADTQGAATGTGSVGNAGAARSRPGRAVHAHSDGSRSMSHTSESTARFQSWRVGRR